MGSHGFALSISVEDQPFTDEELDRFYAAAAPVVSPSPSRKQGTMSEPQAVSRSSRLSGLPGSSSSSNFKGNTKDTYPLMTFGGQVSYSKTTGDVEKAAADLLKKINILKTKNSQVVIGFDIEWKPTFKKGPVSFIQYFSNFVDDEGKWRTCSLVALKYSQGIDSLLASHKLTLFSAECAPSKVALMQICCSANFCYVMHVFYSGITPSLKLILEDDSVLKVGVGIANDAMKVVNDYDVSVQGFKDLSDIANKKIAGNRNWGLSSLTEVVMHMKLLKPKQIRMGNWEAVVLSKEKLHYAATDAFVSWKLYHALDSLPDVELNVAENEKQTLAI